MADDRAEIRAKLEERLSVGEWLKPGEVAVLLGIGRTTVHHKLTSGEIGFKLKGGGVQRLCDPADVRRLLEESRRVRRADPPKRPSQDGTP